MIPYFDTKVELKFDDFKLIITGDWEPKHEGTPGEIIPASFTITGEIEVVDKNGNRADVTDLSLHFFDNDSIRYLEELCKNKLQ